MAFLFTVGLFTRVTSVLVWFASLWYIHRSPLHVFGQDTMQTILLFYLMISPCGAAFSLDALRLRYRAAKAVLGGGKHPPAWASAALAGPVSSWQANFAIRMLQIHYCFIYMSAGMSKLKGSSWWNHEAGWRALATPEFGPMRFGEYETLLRAAVSSQVVSAFLFAAICIGTLLLELGLPIVIWTRLRPVYLTLATTFHLGIGFFMGLTVFGLYMMTFLLVYFPASLIRARLAPAPWTGPKETILYHPGSPRSVRRAALIQMLDLSGRYQLVERTDELTDEIQLREPDGRLLQGEELFQSAFSTLDLVKPIAWIRKVPGVWFCVKFRFCR
ncbi:MAG: hypothetical protein R3B84_02025 [Zavarzinella sp.]